MPALNDAKECLIGPASCRLTPNGPPMRALESILYPFTRGGKRHAFVECHHDVGPERFLNLNRSFGSNMVQRSIQMGLEGHTFVGHLAQLRQTKDLKSTAVGQNGARP